MTTSQKIARWLVSFTFLFTLIAVPLAIETVGCKSTPKAAYVTAQTAAATVEAAMGIWDKYVQDNHPGVAVETKVKAAYDQYRLADIALLKAGKAILEAQNAGNTSAWKQAEAALVASANDLYNLLVSLGVKLP
jgi:hypothetical protein